MTKILLTACWLFSGLLHAAESMWWVVDVRTEAEFNAGHIEGAALMPYDNIAQHIAQSEIDKADIIYLYCRSGRRAEIAKAVLLDMGYEQVVNLGSVANATAFLLQLTGE